MVKSEKKYIKSFNKNNTALPNKSNRKKSNSIIRIHKFKLSGGTLIDDTDMMTDLIYRKISIGNKSSASY